MAHPMNEHRAHKVMKNRVPHIAGKAAGGSAHSDVKEDKALIKKMVKGTALRADGGGVRARADKVSRAKGGRVKGTTVNVIVAPKQQDTPAAPPMAAMPPPMPPKPPMAPPSAPAAMGAVPGLGGMPPMPPRSDGGRAYKKGGAVRAKSDASVKGKDGTGIGDRTPIQHSGNKSDTQNIGRGPAITRATGGPVYADGRKGKQMSWFKGVGAGGGEGRLKKAKHAKSA